MSDVKTAPVEDVRADLDESVAPDRPWLVIVWNDPINLMSFVAFASPIRRRRDGRYAVRLPAQVRTLLGSLAEQMVPMIDSDDPVATRLFPPAYIGDDTADAEKQYRSLVDGALHNHHHQAVRILADTVTADTLSADELS